MLTLYERIMSFLIRPKCELIKELESYYTQLIDRHCDDIKAYW